MGHNKSIDAKDLDKHCIGNWESIIRTLGDANLVDAVNTSNRSKHFDCPACGEKSFRLYRGGANPFYNKGTGICKCGSHSGYQLLMYANNQSFPEVLKDINENLGSPIAVEQEDESISDRLHRIKAADERKFQLIMQQAQRAKEVARLQAIEDEQAMEKLKEVQALSLPNSDPAALPLRLYLEKRGLNLKHIPEGIRFVPSMPLYSSEGDKAVLLGEYPVMLTRFVTDNKAITFHRTYITKNGDKAPVNKKEVKKIMTRPSHLKMNGGHIKLFNRPAPTVRHVTEGVETALAIYQSIEEIVDPAYSANLLASYEPW